MNSQNFNLNLIPGGVPVIVHLSQMDVQSSGLSFSVYDGSAKMSLTGLSVGLHGKKSDGTIFEYSAASVSSDSAIFGITDQMTAVSGKVECELRLTDSSGNDRGTANFIIDVEKSPIDGGVESISDLPEIIQNVTDAKSAAASAASSASAAASSASSASSSKAAAASSASSASGSALAAAKSATSAANSASGASGSASAAAASAKEAASSASAAWSSQTAAAKSESNAATSQKAAASSALASADSAAEAKEYRDAAAGYAGAATYSFMVDRDGYLCLNYKEDSTT